VGEVLDGTWTGMVEIGEITDAVPAEVKAEAEAMSAAIADGSYHPFTGPLNKQDGTPWLAEGEVATDEVLAGMTFYVEGMTGEIPS
jgi:simple sugar transport system substrate-binding protein